MEDQNRKADISSLRIDKDKKFDDRPKSKKWLWLVWITIAVIIILGYFYLKDSVTPAMKVEIGRATLLTGTDANAALVATGYVVAQRKAEVASKGTGRLEYLGFEEGDIVKKNEIIARLDNEDIKAGLDQAEAELVKAETDTIDASRKYQRANELFQSGSITKTELESAETLYLQTQAILNAVQAAVKVAEVNLENTYIRAPFDGTILTKNADVGEMVTPFASSASSKGSVVTLADMTSLEVEADVSESNINKVTPNQLCEIILDAYPTVKYSGYVKKIVPTADRSRATVLTKIAFSDIDKRVLPEMSARVNFFLENNKDQQDQIPVVVVPKDAITTRNGEKVLFVVLDELAIQREITVGRELSDVTEILNGVQQGDRVVISPPGRLETNQKIETSK